MAIRTHTAALSRGERTPRSAQLLSATGLFQTHRPKLPEARPSLLIKLATATGDGVQNQAKFDTCVHTDD